jgi:DNA-binding transcriptional MerR regulator
MSDLYTVAEASKLTGVAKPTLRTYTNRYQRYLSTDATPEHGAERLFTEADLTLLAFVYSYTSAGKTHGQVIEALQDNALDSFDWQLPESQPDSPQSADSIGEALVPMSRLQSAEMFVLDAKQREQTMAEQLEEAQKRNAELERELGQASGELAGFKAAQYKAPKWWRALFGGSWIGNP